MSAFTFDAHQVAPQTARAAWPKGKYRVAIMQSEIKDNSGNKQFSYGAKALERIGGGELPGSLLLQNLHIKHTNADAQRIGQSELSSICHATGVMKLTDTSNLHGHEFVVDVDTRFVQSKNEDGSLKVENGQPVGVTYNDVKGYYKKDGTAITAGAPAAQAPVAATPPQWATAMAPETPPSSQVLTPVEAAKVATIAPAVVPPALPATPEPLFTVGHNGAYVTEKPVNLEAVRALNLPPAEIVVNAYGTPDWIKGEDFYAKHFPVAAAVTDVPPWLMGK